MYKYLSTHPHPCARGAVRAIMRRNARTHVALDLIRNIECLFYGRVAMSCAKPGDSNGGACISQRITVHTVFGECVLANQKKPSKNRLDRLFNIWINPRAQLQHVNARTTRADQTRASALRVIESARAPPLTPFSVQGVTICITRTHSCETQSRLQGWIY